jgi:hypothetical protein
VSSVRRSKAAGGAEGSGRLQSGVIEPGEVRGGKLKGRPWFWACALSAITAGITGGAGRGGSRSHQWFRMIVGSAAKLPEGGRARLAASGSVLERRVKRGHRQ